MQRLVSIITLQQAKYCNEQVCLSVPEDISVAYGCGPVLLQQDDEIPRWRGNFGGFFPIENALYSTSKNVWGLLDCTASAKSDIYRIALLSFAACSKYESLLHLLFTRRWSQCLVWSCAAAASCPVLLLALHVTKTDNNVKVCTTPLVWKIEVCFNDRKQAKQHARLWFKSLYVKLAMSSLFSTSLTSATNLSSMIHFLNAIMTFGNIV